MGCPLPANRVIVVAGTNGKGSTVAGIEAGLHRLGHRVGSYTSPHLLRYNERIRIACQEADEDAIVEGFEKVESALGDTRLTYFEFGTLGAIATMSREALDFAVLEVGLGGRLDAVNIIDAELAVITPIGLDHQEYLGNDRESVGHEKAGVMRRGQTVVCSDRNPPESVLAGASGLGVRLISIGVDFDVSRKEGGWSGSEWKFFYADVSETLPIAMSGAHQGDNLAAALTTTLLVDDFAYTRLDDVAAAIAACRVRGRLELVAEDPDVVVDVGHNPLAAEAIRRYLDGQGRPICRAVLGMLRDKDVEGVARVLEDHVAEWYCTGLETDRGQSGEQLAARLSVALPSARVQICPSVASALDVAVQHARENDLVLAFGSFVTAGEAITHIESLNC